MSSLPASWSQPAEPRPRPRARRRGRSRSPLFVAVWLLIHHGFYRAPARSSTRRSTSATATRSRTGRCRTATSRSSTRRARCRCSRSRRSSIARGDLERLPGRVRGGDARLRSARPRADALDPAPARRGPARTFAALAFAALAPLLLGSVVLSRFDLWPAALDGRRRWPRSSSGQQPAGRGRARAGDRREDLPGGALSPRCGLGVAAGGPARGARLPRRPRRRRCSRSSSRSWCSRRTGSGTALTTQTSRPLQIETLGAGVLLVAARGRRARDHDEVEPRLAEPRRQRARTRSRSLQTIAPGGRGDRASGSGSRAGRPTASGSCARSAAAVCAFVAFGKVLSPQFLIWLVPLVPLVRGRRGLAAGGLLAAALVADAALVPVPLLGPRRSTSGRSRRGWCCSATSLLRRALRGARRPNVRGPSERAAPRSPSPGRRRRSRRPRPRAGRRPPRAGSVRACPCASAGSRGRPRRRSPSRAGRSSRRP